VLCRLTLAPQPIDPVVSSAEATEADPASAAAEYGGEFRTDVETFVSRAAVVPGRYELPPVADNAYLAFVDRSGGSADSMTLADRSQRRQPRRNRRRARAAGRRSLLMSSRFGGNRGILGGWHATWPSERNDRRHAEQSVHQLPA
jgi:hypothetical protein